MTRSANKEKKTGNLSYNNIILTLLGQIRELLSLCQLKNTKYKQAVWINNTSPLLKSVVNLAGMFRSVQLTETLGHKQRTGRWGWGSELTHMRMNTKPMAKGGSEMTSSGTAFIMSRRNWNTARNKSTEDTSGGNSRRRVGAVLH